MKNFKHRKGMKFKVFSFFFNENLKINPKKCRGQALHFSDFELFFKK